MHYNNNINSPQEPTAPPQEKPPFAPPRIYVYPFVHDERVIEPRNASHDYLELETRLLEGLRQRNRIVTHPEQATHFWIPSQTLTYALAGHWRTFAANFRWYVTHHLRPIFRQVYHDYPYFNQSGGADHVWVFPMDNGPICTTEFGLDRALATDRFLQDMMLRLRVVGYHGQEGLERRIVPNDDGNDTSRVYHVRGHHHHHHPGNGVPTLELHSLEKWKNLGHDASSSTIAPCWDKRLDIAVPQWHNWNMSRDSWLERAARKCQEPIAGSAAASSTSQECHVVWDFLHRRANEVTHLFAFAGQVVVGYHCSKGVRLWLQFYCRQHPKLCLFKKRYHPTLLFQMTRAVFAACPAGWACWSSRFYNAIYQGVVPLVMADGMIFPFGDGISYDSFMEQVDTGNPVSLEDNGGEAFDRLVRLGKSWTRTCRDMNQTMDCLQHPISQKMIRAIQIREYMGWQNVETNRNAFYLFEQELMKPNAPIRR